MTGFGTAPCGIFAMGFGEDAEIQGPPEQPITGATFINPRTRDYEVNDDGSYQRMPTTRHRVLVLLMTELDSSVRIDGRDPVGLKLPDKIGVSFKQQADQAVRECLAPLADDIRIDSVTTTVLNTGRVEIVVDYTDLTTGNSDTVTV
jgi:hypothetical protein